MKSTPTSSSQIPIAGDHNLMPSLELRRLAKQGDRYAKMELDFRRKRQQLREQPEQKK